MRAEFVEFAADVLHVEPRGAGIFLRVGSPRHVRFTDAALPAAMAFEAKSRERLYPGITAAFDGTFRDGRFSAGRVLSADPGDSEAVRRVLASGLFPGIGGWTARALVEELGPDVIRAAVNGAPGRSAFSGRKGEAIRESIRSTLARTHPVSIRVAALGYTPFMARVVARDMGLEGFFRIVRDPYSITECRGVGFKRADEAARRIFGLSPLDPRRVRAAILFLLREALSEGHCALPEDKILEGLAEFGIEDRKLVANVLRELERSGKCVNEPPLWYLAEVHKTESRVMTLLSVRSGEASDFSRIPGAVSRAAQVSGFPYQPDQIEAAVFLLRSRIGVLAGPPGTGKTTTVRLLIEACRAMGLSVELAAPTGKAAARLSEAAGLRARTVHRLLEYAPDRKKNGRPSRWKFLRNRERPLSCHVLIVDEASMIDIFLMRAILEAVPPDGRVIFVGDPDQLPPVGAGQPFHGMVRGKLVPVRRLEVIRRQAETSGIIRLVHAIRYGRKDAIRGIFGSAGDVFFLDVNLKNPADPERLARLIARTAARALELADPLEIQFLAPMKAGRFGTEHIARLVRPILAPALEREAERLVEEAAAVPGVARTFGNLLGRRSEGMGFRFGDRVIHTVNDYDADVVVLDDSDAPAVFNGEVGLVIGLDPVRKELLVHYGTKIVRYSGSRLSHLDQAYCLTVHKAQGSEYDFVALVLLARHFVLLSRPLVYTAVSRARKKLVVLGEERALWMAVDRIGETRYGRL